MKAGTPIEAEASANPLVRMALDFGPILVFFVVNAIARGTQLEQVMIATAAFMAATVAAMGVSKLYTGRISPILWLSGVLVVVFGGLTLIFRDEDFIKMKPTIVYLMMAAVLAYGAITRKPMLQMLLETAYPGLNERGWHLLTINWTVFFVVMAIVNEIVWRNVGWDTWVGFKLWGVLPATLIFAGLNIPMLLRHGLMAKPLEAEGAAAPPLE